MCKILYKGELFTCDECGKELYELIEDIHHKKSIIKSSIFKALNGMPKPKNKEPIAKCFCGGKWHMNNYLGNVIGFHTKDGWTHEIKK